MLDVKFCRQQFPSFSDPVTSTWAFFENAGGSYVPATVCDRLNGIFRKYKVQPYGLSAMSIRLGEEMDAAYAGMAELINAEAEEITLGPSTTLNVYVLAHAIRPLLQEGDEIVVTNQDHEANVGAWRRYAESGISVREWRIDPGSGELDVSALEQLITPRTRLICFTLCSNIVGTMNAVEPVTRLAREVGAMVVVDGVSYAPHRVVDVKRLDVDFVLFSTYKTFGTHLGVLWGKSETLSRLPAQSHYFNAESPRYRMNPTGPLHAEIAALNGVYDYYNAAYDHHFKDHESNLHKRAAAVFSLFAEHEARIANKLLDYLRDNPAVRLIGKDRADGERAATISLTIPGRAVDEVAKHLATQQVGVGCGDFYAVRCIESLGIPLDPGVIRVSMVHYNTEEEVDRLIAALDEVI